MPVKVTKNRDGSYRVSTPNGVHAKSTTKEKAEAQKRLIDAIDHNPEFAKQHGIDGNKLRELKSKRGR